MNISEFIQRYATLGIQLWVEDNKLHYKAPQGVMTLERKQEIINNKTAIISYIQSQIMPLLIKQPEQRFSPFPLTDIQAAYLVGRQDYYQSGGTGCHGYVELKLPRINANQLELAWHQVILRHDMLRAIVMKSGYQQVLKEIELPPLIVHDLTELSDQEEKTKLADIRKDLSHKVYQTECWPLYDMQLSHIANGSIIHFSIDMLIADFVSLQILFRELDNYYHNTSTLAPVTLTFRDFILSKRAQLDMPFIVAQRERDRQYWLNKIDDLPPAPQLPLLLQSDACSKRNSTNFTRYSHILPSSQWQSLCLLGREQQLTPSSVVLACFAEVIGFWSQHKHFCLNITRLDRPNQYPDIYQVIGDFTAVNILSITPIKDSSFIGRVKAIQNQLWQDIEHSLFSGIEVLREINRRTGEKNVMPIVFTSTLGVTVDSQHGLMQDAELYYGISQTPQVWLDCQIFEQSDQLVINWDVRDDIFIPDVIVSAFHGFTDLLDRLTTQPKHWSESYPLILPDAMRQMRKQINQTTNSTATFGTLINGFHLSLQKAPDAIALICQQQQWSYRELSYYANAIKIALEEKNCQVGDIVAVILDKGVYQIAAVLGILAIGAIYLPIDTAQPIARQNKLLSDAQVKIALIQDEHNNGFQNITSLYCIDVNNLSVINTVTFTFTKIDPNQPAYLIYTSGSTGQPKGVLMSHKAAVNTLLDINDRFSITCSDRILGLANLSFDLSVYDIFGTFYAGATLVLPESEQRLNPAHWAKLIASYQITIWNSVPAQLQMLMTYLVSDPIDISSLRLALLSGDKIPLTLPITCKQYLPKMQIISLGGATEAAIWSIFYPIDTNQLFKQRIPYGYPLTNQRFYILDENNCSCPDWVSGEICIAGMGLAIGYFNDTKRTNERFVEDVQTGERLYRTGDLGFYRPDGIIEIVGRNDKQIKIRGYRIELGEIEVAIESHPAILNSVVMINNQEIGDKRLIAFFDFKHDLGLQVIHLYPQLSKVCEQVADHYLANHNKTLLLKWIELIDRVSLLEMLKTLYSLGLFNKNSIYTLDEIYTVTHVANKFKRLLRRWLNVLCQENWLKYDENFAGYQLCYLPDLNESQLCWQQLTEIEQKLHCSPELLNYLHLSSQHLVELLKGECDPLTLLFPQGQLDVSLAAYNDNLINKNLNQVLTAAVDYISQQKISTFNNQRTLRILEIGAGVGGTSINLIPSLKDYRLEYYFTDISPFFLNEARQRFANYPFVSYGLFDINKPYLEQGLQSNSWDIIIAANVLHNSRHIHKALSQLKMLATPGGTLVMIEATQESYPIMTSMEFKEGLTEFYDQRNELEQTFFNRQQWQQNFNKVNANLLYNYPADNDPLINCGQTVFVAEFPNDRNFVSPSELDNYLRTLLPDYMLPDSYEPLYTMPLSNNGKIDRNVLLSYLKLRQTPESPKIATELPLNELEQRIAMIWSDAIGISTINRHDNFFAIGGDSLLIAQVVAKMRQQLSEAANWNWDTLMRTLLKQPTVASIAEHLKYGTIKKESDLQTESNSFTMNLLAKAVDPASKEIMVIIHDGLGTLAPYHYLLPLLLSHPTRKQAVFGFSLKDNQRLLNIPATQLITELAQKYADMLIEYSCQQNITKINLIGFCMGGLLATSIAQILLESGYTTHISVISSDRCRYKIEDNLLQERAFASLLGANLVNAGHDINDEILGQALNQIIVKDNTVVTANAIQQLGHEFTALKQSYHLLSNETKEQRFSRIATSITTETYQPEQLMALYAVFCHCLNATYHYQPQPFFGSVTIFHDDESLYFLPALHSNQRQLWNDIAFGQSKWIDISGNHLSCMSPPYVEHLVDLLLNELEEIK